MSHGQSQFHESGIAATVVNENSRQTREWDCWFYKGDGCVQSAIKSHTILITVTSKQLLQYCKVNFT